MDPNRKSWNIQQQALRQALQPPGDHPKAIELFLVQHAMVHSSKMARSGLFSFDDELWQGMNQEAARHVLKNKEHSIAWMIWHIARIEDITMNLLIAGSRQVFSRDKWAAEMNVAICDTGNSLSAEGVADLSIRIDIVALRAYRTAVGRRTREIVSCLQPGEVKQKVKPERLQHIRNEGVVAEAADWLLRYWGGLTIAGLLLMPPTRHNFVHLNEALRSKPKPNLI